MAKESRKRIKTYFQTGDQPTENEFINVFDSTLNLSGSNAITGSLIISGSTSDNADGSAPNLHVMGDITSSGNILALGDVIARNYIVSSSITNITTQTMSGSTEFGNSTDDTHQFTGHITASANISASGTVIANKMAIGTNNNNPTDGHLEVHGAIHVEGVGGGSQYLNISTNASGVNNAKILARGNKLLIKNNADFGVGSIDLEGQRINLLAPVTASGNISASGTIISDRLQSFGVESVNTIVGPTHIGGLVIPHPSNVLRVDGASTFTSHITASGNISSSGTGTNYFGGNIQLGVNTCKHNSYFIIIF